MLADRVAATRWQQRVDGSNEKGHDQASDGFQPRLHERGVRGRRHADGGFGEETRRRPRSGPRVRQGHARLLRPGKVCVKQFEVLNNLCLLFKFFNCAI